MPREYRYEVLRESICPPAVRMLVLVCDGSYDSSGSPELEITPLAVVALRSRTSRTWHHHQQGKAFPDGYQAREESGWNVEETCQAVEPLIVPPHEFETICTPEELYEAEGCLVYEIVVCTWPPEQDHARFDAHRARLFQIGEKRLETRRLNREADRARAAAAKATARGSSARPPN